MLQLVQYPCFPLEEIDCRRIVGEQNFHDFSYASFVTIGISHILHLKELTKGSFGERLNHSIAPLNQSFWFTVRTSALVTRFTKILALGIDAVSHSEYTIPIQVGILAYYNL
jgi:hypothetical protein